MPSPLEALGVILACKYRQFRQRRHEAANRRVTERELSALHYKIVSGLELRCRSPQSLHKGLLQRHSSIAIYDDNQH